jgi:hypothetical protein
MVLILVMEYVESPFELTLKEKVFKKRGTRKGRLTDTSSGELIDVVELSEDVKMVYDPFPYCKVFKQFYAPILSGGLSKGSIRILFNVMMGLKPNQLEVRIERKDFKGLGGGKFNQAVKGLVEFGYLVETTRRSYFINPNMFFNGDRKKIKKRGSNFEGAGDQTEERVGGS